jgi:3-oxoacyl-[acyl-carrier-protein] synthase II
MAEREIVITGMGLVTPLGNTVEDNWENLRAMKTGIGHYPRQEQPEFLHYFGEVQGFAPPQGLTPKLLSQMKFLNRGSLLGFGAACEAVLQSRINLADIAPERRALYVAAGDLTKIGSEFMHPAIQDATAGFLEHLNREKLNDSTLNKVNPFFLLESIINNLFSFLSAYFEFMGSNTCLASLSPCGSNALELACRGIRQGWADAALAVGCGNWITEVALYEMDRLGMLSKGRSGVHSFKPFDRNRDGFFAGEGGAALFLESVETAKGRGALIFGKVRGIGNTLELPVDMGADGSSGFSPSSIRLAMEEAGCDSADLAFACAHGNGTRAGDRSELSTLKDILGVRSPYIPLCGLKPYTGHLAAASDLAEIILGIRALSSGMVPGTLNFVEADEEFRDLNISGVHQACRGRHFLTTSYGTGGQSSAVIVEIA